MKVKRSDIYKNLPKKGFVKNPSGDHIYFHHKINDRSTGIYTKISHTKKLQDYSKGLLTAIRKQLKLNTNSQVVDLAECPLDGDEYNQILIENGSIPNQ